MGKYLLQGFLLGIAYVAPIGMQNIYVINSALKNSKLKAYMVALTTVFFDVMLALACFFGMGLIMERFNTLKLLILALGSVAIIYIGVQLIRSEPSGDREVDTDIPFLKIVATCCLVTWGNPQALIDGSLLLGGFKASLPEGTSHMFILGVILASASWFLGLTTVISTFKSKMSDKILRGINIICGSVLVYYGVKLAYSFLTEIF